MFCLAEVELRQKSYQHDTVCVRLCEYEPLLRETSVCMGVGVKHVFVCAYKYFQYGWYALAAPVGGDNGVVQEPSWCLAA